MKSIFNLLLLFSFLSYSQENIFLEPDAIPNCNSMKNGTFISTQYSAEEYHMIVKDGTQTEYIENGQYVKSKMEFINECEYKTSIIEVTIPDYFAKVGDFLTTRIIETQCEFIKVKSIMFGEEYIFVYIKMK